MLEVISSPVDNCQFALIPLSFHPSLFHGCCFQKVIHDLGCSWSIAMPVPLILLDADLLVRNQCSI